MNKQDVIEFFDRCAPCWDAEMIKSDAIIGKILDNAEVGEGMDVLDVACGTGVMLPYYLELGVKSVTGIDISPEMAKIAAGKFAGDHRVTILCGDVETALFDRKFDRIVVYNAFPHFPDPQNLIKTLSSLLKEDGRLTIAHGASREAIDGHHSGSASKVSNGLMAAQDLADLFGSYLDVEVMVSNRRMYQVSGVRRGGHSHSHSHGHGGHTHSHGGHTHSHDHVPSDTPMEELLALMKFMVNHNDSHAQELAGLADQLKAAGNQRAYRRLMNAVADFDAANAQLEAVRAELCEDDCT